MNKKSGLLKDDRKNRPRLIGELRAARRKITALQRRQAALNVDEISFRLFFDNSGDAVLLTQPDGTILAANPEACRMFGRSEKEIKKLGRSGVMDLKDPRLPVALEQRRQTGLFKGELNYKKKDGTVIPCDITSKIFRDSCGSERTVMIIRDLDERKKVEEALRESEERFRRLSEAAFEGILIHEGGVALVASKQFCDMFGYQPDELLGKQVIPLTVAPESRDTLKRQIATGGREPYEVIGLKKDGSTFPIVIRARESEHEGHRIRIAVIRDITVRKRMEEELRISESKLRALSLELSLVEERERKRLAMFLHDEIGQSLALLRMKFGSLAGVLESKFGKQDIQQIRDLLEKTIDQTHTLTFELSPPVLHQLGLEAAIEWAGEKIGHDFESEFVFSDDGRIKPLSADIKALLFRCVRELMLNTVKHAKAKRLTVSLTRREERAFVVVEDDGIGFDTSPPGGQAENVGFGLFSVRERLGAVGGSYELQSEPGRGTRITLSIPLKEEKPSS